MPARRRKPPRISKRTGLRLQTRLLCGTLRPQLHLLGLQPRLLLRRRQRLNLRRLRPGHLHWKLSIRTMYRVPPRQCRSRRRNVRVRPLSCVHLAGPGATRTPKYTMPPLSRQLCAPALWGLRRVPVRLRCRHVQVRQPVCPSQVIFFAFKLLLQFDCTKNMFDMIICSLIFARERSAQHIRQNLSSHQMPGLLCFELKLVPEWLPCRFKTI